MWLTSRSNNAALTSDPRHYQSRDSVCKTNTKHETRFPGWGIHRGLTPPTSDFIWHAGARSSSSTIVILQACAPAR